MTNVKNVDKLMKKMNKFDAEINGIVKKTMTKEVIRIDAELKSSIQTGNRSGKVYRRKTVTHIASAPGESPKTDTGELVASFFWKIASQAKQVFGTIENISSHAMPLEYKPAAKGGRPFMRPSFRKNKDKVVNAINMATKQFIKGVYGG